MNNPTDFYRATRLPGEKDIIYLVLHSQHHPKGHLSQLSAVKYTNFTFIPPQKVSFFLEAEDSDFEQYLSMDRTVFFVKSLVFSLDEISILIFPFQWSRRNRND